MKAPHTDAASAPPNYQSAPLKTKDYSLFFFKKNDPILIDGLHPFPSVIFLTWCQRELNSGAFFFVSVLIQFLLSAFKNSAIQGLSFFGSDLVTEWEFLLS